MAARALWKGAISFGLVYIPVEMYTAVQEHDLDLTMLDRRDFSPVGYKRYNKKTGKEVTWDDIVKGYEYEDNEYVVLSDEDLKRANVEATQTIDIVAFVEAADVPLTYYETPYYLAPSRGGAKVYALLRETLRKAGKIGIATVVMRTKQHLCALVCVEDKIVLNTLRYATEIRSAEELKLPPATLKAAGISDKELQMALSLVDGMSEEWKPEQYHDTYKEDVMAMVKKKIKAGQTKTITEPEAEPSAPKASNVVDLVALLQDSLGKRGGTKAAKPKARAATEEEDDDEGAAKPKSRAGTSTTSGKPARSRGTATTATTRAKSTSTATAAKRKPAASRKAA
ncbi:DNA end-binding protein Ku [Duganella sp. 1224]|uniref:non-homologous end joining protein Ku n=1 Tax=Duganella sp. 1224 TaxID=2587052 RepID=UPI0015CC592B|nr:Ku protein [Duganella sp. 1224]NYE60611.1 DNA end-binding protein Ku [Duganella sp. 1224]